MLQTRSLVRLKSEVRQHQKAWLARVAQQSQVYHLFRRSQLINLKHKLIPDRIEQF